MKGLLIVILFMTGLAPLCAHAQFNQVNFYPPQAAELMKKVDYPVSHLTGMPDIRIPLHTIKAGTLSLPIELSFHIDSYIKANQMPGPAGAGWSLSSDIQISRAVNGGDDLNGGYCLTSSIPANYTGGVQTRTRSEKYQMVTGARDEEPDKFFYQLLGKQGSFYFQKQSSGDFLPVPVPFNGVKINYNFTTKQFTIIDTDGTTYLFSTTKTDGSANGDGTKSAILSWKCESVTNAAGVQELAFTYGNNYSKLESSFSDKIEVYDDITDLSTYIDREVKPNPGGFDAPPQYEFWQTAGPKMFEYAALEAKYLIWNHEGYFQDNGYYYNEFPDASRTLRSVKNYLLTGVSFRDGSVVFNYINDEQLVSIQVKNAANETVRTISFIESTTGTPTGHELYTNKIRHSRKLDTLWIDNQRYTFQYGFDRQYGDVTDFWGYEADLASSHCAVPYQQIDMLSGNQRFYYNGYPIDHQVPLNSVMIGEGPTEAMIFELIPGQRTALTINYPTAGSTEFIVGQHRFRDPVDETIKGTGGYRIEKIRSYDGVHTGPVNEKVYKYGPDEDGTGIIKSIPSFDPVTGNNYLTEVNTYGFEPELASGFVPTTSTRKRTYFSTSTRSLIFNNGAPINYNTVTEYNSDMGALTGKTVYKYDIYSYSQEYSSPTDPFPFERNDWALGMPDWIIHYKYNDQTQQFDWVKKTDMNYTKYTFPAQIFQGRSSLRGNNIIVESLKPTPDLTQAYLTETTANLEYKYSSIETGVMQLANEIVTEKDDAGNVMTTQTSYFYNNPDPSVISRMETTGSDNALYVQHTTYPNDYAASGVFATLIANNIVSVPVEQILRKNGKIISANIAAYNSNGTVASTYQVEENPKLNESAFRMSNRAAAGDYTSTSPNTAYSIDPHYVKKADLTWNNYLNMLQITPVGNMSLAYLWDYHDQYPVAQVENATFDEIAYTSFESDGTGNWTVNSSIRNGTDAITGKKCYDLGLGTMTKSGLNPAKVYIFSFWAKYGADVGANGTQATVAGAQRNGWLYFEKTVTGISTITVSGSGLVDEVRLYPKGAQMTTHTYSPPFGMTTTCDANNSITYYDYDMYGRLVLVRDQHKNILKKICYNYAGQPENCSFFSNVLHSQTFTRNNCSVGYNGTQVIYTVPAGKYFSATSQAEADAQAQAEIDAKGQQHANDEGDCNEAVIYARLTLPTPSGGISDVIVEFFEDAACTIPANVTNLTVNVLEEVYNDLYGTYTYYPHSFVCNGSGATVLYSVPLMESGPNGATLYRNFGLDYGNYTIVY